VELDGILLSVEDCGICNLTNNNHVAHAFYKHCKGGFLMWQI